MILARVGRPHHLDDPPPDAWRAARCWCWTSWMPDGEPTGGYLIAVDTVGAGAGETVIMLDEGNGARQILGGRRPADPVGGGGDRRRSGVNDDSS